MSILMSFFLFYSSFFFFYLAFRTGVIICHYYYISFFLPFKASKYVSLSVAKLFNESNVKWIELFNESNVKWIELFNESNVECCLSFTYHIWISSYRATLYFVYLCLYPRLSLFMSYICDLFTIFIFITIKHDLNKTDAIFGHFFD